jgi:hypothetical protein
LLHRSSAGRAVVRRGAAVEVRELPEELARMDELLSDPGPLAPIE